MVSSPVSPLAFAQPLRCPLPLLGWEMSFSRALLPSGGQVLLLLPESQAEPARSKQGIAAGRMEELEPANHRKVSLVPVIPYYQG